jgi:hypothetical protein
MEHDFLVWCPDNCDRRDATLVMCCFDAEDAVGEYAIGHEWEDLDEILVLVVRKSAPDDPPQRFRVEREFVAAFTATEESDDGKPAKEGG